MRGFCSITGIAFSSQLAIATLQIAENFRSYVEVLLFAIVKMQIQKLFGVFTADITLCSDFLSAWLR